MTFIIALIALVIERFFHWNHLRRWRWFNLYQRSIIHSPIYRLPSFFVIMVSVLPMALLVGLISYLLDGWLFGILKIMFGLVVLLYCLGPVNFWMQTYGWLNQINKEEDQAMVFENIKKELGLGSIEDAEHFQYSFIKVILIASFRQVFAVLFWFVILGPFGAVFYRSIAFLRLEAPMGVIVLAKQIGDWLDWIPARILTIFFALAGNFTQTILVWKQMLLQNPDMNDNMIADCGVAALGQNLTPKEAISLLDRVFVIALLILGVIVIAL